jgi:hypothetical protein
MLWDDFNTTRADQPLAGNKQLFSRGVSKADLGQTAAKARFVPHCVNSPIGNFAVAANVRSEGPHRSMPITA